MIRLRIFRKKSRCRALVGLLFAIFSVFLQGCASTAQTTAFLPRTDLLPAYIKDMDFSEHLDISVGYWNIDEMVKASKPDDMTRCIEELFNITLNPVSVTWSNYEERYQILSATGNLPDVFATITLSSTDNNTSATFEDFIRTESIRALPDDLGSFPRLKEIYDSVPYTRYSDGKYYAIPRVSFLDPMLGSTDAAMLVRRDWMNTLGIRDPENFTEFQKMVSAFAQRDPDGNGVDDTIGYNVNNLSALGKWLILGIAPECNVYSWISENGRYIPSWTTEEFNEVIRCFRQLYQAEGLDPDFYKKSPSAVMDDFASGHLGALEYKSSPSALMELKDKWDKQNGKPFEECVDVLPVFPAPDGIRYSNSSSIFWSESYISSEVDDKKLERILALFEFLLTEQGQDFCHFGIEGTDYKVNEDGSYTCLIETGSESLTTVLARKYPSSVLFSGIATWGGSEKDFEVNEINTLRYGSFNTFLANKSVKWYRENTTQVERPYAFLNYPKEATEKFSTSRAFEEFITCITGQDDPVRMWQNVLDGMRAEGLEEYIDRQNRNFLLYGNNEIP